MAGKITECTYLGALEFDLAGRVSRVHAVPRYDGQVWYTTVCGLPIQPYPPTGAGWDAVDPAERCGRCATALGPEEL